MRALLAISLLATLVTAGETAGLDVPRKSPLAKRKRAEADTLWLKARAVHERVRKGETPTDDQLRAALGNIERAIELFERAQRMEWSLDINTIESEALRSWVALRAITPPLPPPDDPELRIRFEKKQRSRATERKRDARRFVSKMLQARKHTKVFGRCGRCDGRGELRTAFGEKSNCPLCRGMKHTTDRKNLLKAYWFAHTPFFRGDGRNRSLMNFVLRTGVRGEERIAQGISPFILTSNVSGKVEAHDWWFKVTAKEKVIEKGTDKKGTERNTTYIVVNVGRVWWLHAGRVDKDLLVVPEG